VTWAGDRSAWKVNSIFPPSVPRAFHSFKMASGDGSRLPIGRSVAIMGITWARYVHCAVSTDLCELAKRSGCHSTCSHNRRGSARALCSRGSPVVSPIHVDPSSRSRQQRVLRLGRVHGAITSFLPRGERESILFGNDRLATFRPVMSAGPSVDAESFPRFVTATLFHGGKRPPSPSEESRFSRGNARA